MPRLLVKHLPRYESLLAASQEFKELDPSAFEAYLHLLRTGDRAAELLSGYVTHHGISPGRFTVLLLLLHWTSCAEQPEGPTPATLADTAGCTRATMTGLIDTLEGDGFVKRVADARDRRRMEVTLTGKGTAAVRKLLPGYFTRVGALLSGLSVSERKTLVRLHTKIAEQAEALAGGTVVNDRRRQPACA